MNNLDLVEDLKSGKITLDYLANELSIIIKDSYDDRYVLNYNQISSPKDNEYVIQCRGIVIDKNFNVLCRPFDRFFNIGECIDHNKYINWATAECYEKVDGSLIKIYYDGVNWCAATRGTAFAESDVYGWDLNFVDLVYKSLNVDGLDSFNILCDKHLDRKITYLFDVTSRENRVVTQYNGYTLWYLASRYTESGEYVRQEDAVVALGAILPKVYKFGTVEDCIHTASNLPDLQEGYVLYQDGKPFCKIKSPSYVAVHHIRGEGLNPKRIMQLLLLNEQDEYLKYFPEDEEFFTKYRDALNEFHITLYREVELLDGIEDRKEFALKVKDRFYSSVLFSWKFDKSKDIVKVFNDSKMSYKMKIFERIMGV